MGSGATYRRARSRPARHSTAGGDGQRRRRRCNDVQLHAKYHYLFWRPVTAINGSLDPTAVTNDGFGPVPGYDDGNPATVEQAGWRPLLATPNHPEYPVRALHAHVGNGRGVQDLFRDQPASTSIFTGSTLPDLLET